MAAVEHGYPMAVESMTCLGLTRLRCGHFCLGWLAAPRHRTLHRPSQIGGEGGAGYSFEAALAGRVPGTKYGKVVLDVKPLTLNIPLDPCEMTRYNFAEPTRLVASANPLVRVPSPARTYPATNIQDPLQDPLQDNILCSSNVY